MHGEPVTAGEQVVTPQETNDLNARVLILK
jgi:hypothetical protein